MKAEKVGTRGVLFAFDDPINVNVYLILGENHVFVCDTSCGPQHMEIVDEFLKKEGHSEKSVVVFNSHADWDHIWGNCFFEGTNIIAHDTGWGRFMKGAEESLARHLHYTRGEVILTPPTLYFTESIDFKGEGVEFFYSPGHTVDSASCYDSMDKVLFVGDNIETPLPYVNTIDFESYIASLERYLEIDWQTIVPSHDPIQKDSKLVKSNLEYIRAFADWTLDIEELEDAARKQHFANLSKIAEDIVKAGLKQDALKHYTAAESILEKQEQDDVTKDALSSYRKVTG